MEGISSFQSPFQLLCLWFFLDQLKVGSDRFGCCQAMISWALSSSGSLSCVALEGRKMMRLMFIPLVLATGGMGLGMGAVILGRRGSRVGLFAGVPGVRTMQTPCLTLFVPLSFWVMSAVGRGCHSCQS